MKYYIFIILITLFMLVGCDFGLKEELNSQEALEFIESGKQSASTSDLERINVDEIIVNDSLVLFVENSFNGDFNGRIYSHYKHQNWTGKKVGDFVVLDQEETKGSLTKVYGKW